MKEEKVTRLQKWGAEQEKTMERFLNDEDLYVQCIGVFLDDAHFDHLKQSLDTKDYHEAFEDVHTLKGVAANLGLDPIYQPLSALTEELRHQRNQNLEDYRCQIEKKRSELREIMK